MDESKKVKEEWVWTKPFDDLKEVNKRIDYIEGMIGFYNAKFDIVKKIKDKLLSISNYELSTRDWNELWLAR